MATEKRLIDANALLACFEAEYKQSTYPYFHMDEIADEIIKAPTVDAVEVVRCKDCEMTRQYKGGLWCDCNEFYVDDEGFCSSGARKDNG